MEPAQIERTPFADLDGQPSEMTAMLLAALEGWPGTPRSAGSVVPPGRLRPAPGQRLLDAGSGRVTWRAGSPRMWRRAARWWRWTIRPPPSRPPGERHDGSDVRYATGDVCALDLADDSFDGVWCERVLQHVDDAERAIGELVRVTRPGGRICLIDTDWGSLAFDGVPGLARRRGHMHGRLTPLSSTWGVRCGAGWSATGCTSDRHAGHLLFRRPGVGRAWCCRW